MLTSDLLLQIAARGVLVNNLFQLSTSKWRASLRDEDFGYEFGEGTTPDEALQAALVAYYKQDKSPLITASNRKIVLPRKAKPISKITLDDL